MQWKTPKNSDKYEWTAHVSEKMHFYGLSEQKVLGVIRNPKRIETGIAQNTVAVMMPVGERSLAQLEALKNKVKKSTFGNFSSDRAWNQEVWVMYQTSGQKAIVNKIQNSKEEKGKDKKSVISNSANRKICIISAWRYPGVSPKKNPIPEEIMREIEEMGIVG